MYNNFITSIEARIELYREVLWSDSSMETTNNFAAVNWRAHFMLKTFARTNWANTESHFSIAPLFRALQLNVECIVKIARRSTAIAAMQGIHIFKAIPRNSITFNRRQ